MCSTGSQFSGRVFKFFNMLPSLFMLTIQFTLYQPRRLTEGLRAPSALLRCLPAPWDIHLKLRRDVPGAAQHQSATPPPRLTTALSHSVGRWSRCSGFLEFYCCRVAGTEPGERNDGSWGHAVIRCGPPDTAVLPLRGSASGWHWSTSESLMPLWVV